MKKAFFQILYQMAGENPDLIFIKGDTAYIPDFRKQYPRQYLDVGIAEQNMIGVAAGMALEGKIPVTYSIVNFATMRCLEQIRNDIAYNNLNVKIVSCGQGVDYGNLGPTHHATEDLAIMRALPNMTVFCPCDPVETTAVFKKALLTDGPCFIRNGHGGERVLHEAPLDEFKVGEALPLTEGTDVVICVSGSIADDALTAARELRGLGYDVGLYSFPTVKPIDKEFILDRIATASLILSVEEHNIIGGLGSAIAEIVAEAGPHKAVFRRIGIRDVFTDEIGSREYLKCYYKIDAEAIKKTVIETLR